MTPTELQERQIYFLKQALKDTISDLRRANQIIKDQKFCLEIADKTLEIAQDTIRSQEQELILWRRYVSG